MRAELRTAPVLYVDDDTVECVMNAPHGALILAKDDCGSCAQYEVEIQRLQDRELLDHLPYTVLYASGEKVDEFAASKGFFLMERAEDAGLIGGVGR